MHSNEDFLSLLLLFSFATAFLLFLPDAAITLLFSLGTAAAKVFAKLLGR